MLKMADFRVPPACRGNLKEGVIGHTRFCELWLRDWYYLDWRVMTGRGKTSGAWGVAFGIFVLFGLYGALVGNRRDEPFVFTRELAGALLLIGFQIVFHGLYPWARIYWLRRDP
jgi:hypothetical protein